MTDSEAGASWLAAVLVLGAADWLLNRGGGEARRGTQAPSRDPVSTGAGLPGMGAGPALSVDREKPSGVEGHADEPKREAHGERDEAPNRTIPSSPCVRGFAAERERRQRMEPALAGIKPGLGFSRFARVGRSAGVRGAVCPDGSRRAVDARDGERTPALVLTGEGE